MILASLPVLNADDLLYDAMLAEADVSELEEAGLWSDEYVTYHVAAYDLSDTVVADVHVPANDVDSCVARLSARPGVRRTTAKPA